MSTKQKLILKHFLSPGDVMTLTAAIESLHLTYPDEYETDVRTSCDAIFENNPRITKLDELGARVIDMHYNSIHRSDEESIPFIGGMVEHLENELQVGLRLRVNRPMLYLSEAEKSWVNQIAEIVGWNIPFMVVNAGIKADYTAKLWPTDYYQAVINATRGLVQWVQIGDTSHNHPALSNVIDLRGKTDIRQLIRLVYHSRGGLGPITFLQHICAAFQKPYIALLGGREPAIWVQYPLQHTLHTIGMLDCCATRSCWKSRVVPSDDLNDPKNLNTCKYPIRQAGALPVAKCMAMIMPDEVISIIRRIFSR